MNISKIDKKRYPLYLILPGFAVFLVFFLLPNLIGVFYSFTNWDLFSADFVGLENYKNILSDKRLTLAYTNTLKFAIFTTTGKMVFGLLFALILNRALKLKNYYRTVWFMPAIMNNVAVGLIFTAILHPKNGILNGFLNAVGLDFLAMNWLGDIKFALYSVMFVEVWKWTGFTMIIFLAGLQSIDKHFYEAADIDGASPWQKFRYITMPLIMPAFNNSFIISIIGGLKAFDIIFAMTNGGPGTATNVINIMVYKAFSNGRYGEAAAGVVLLTIIIAVIAVTANTILRKKEVEY